MARAISVHNLLNRKYKLLPFEGAWFDAFKRPSASGAWFIYGASGNGKSSFAQQMVKYLASLGLRIAYLSLEEGDDHTMQEAVILSQWEEYAKKIIVVPHETVDEIDARLSKHKSPDILVIDTVQYWDITFSRYLELKRKHPKKLFIFISHVVGINPETKIATRILRDASLKIFVQGFRAISKGRYIGPKGYYTVWEERAREYWAEGI